MSLLLRCLRSEKVVVSKSLTLNLLKQQRQQQHQHQHQQKRTLTSERPRRALLYLPANNEKFVRKATTLNVDTLVLDLEDAVAPNQKDQARIDAINSLQKYKFGKSEISIRINPFGSIYCQKDVHSILKSSILPHSICLPKCQSAEDIQWLDHQIHTLCGEKGNSIEIIGMIETPQAIIKADSICKASKRLSAIIFGGDDFAAAMGAVRTPSNHEIWHARNEVLLYSKANELQSIDIVNIHLKNPELFEKECKEGFEMGFDGKQVIHPTQAEVAQELFSPSKDKIKWALSIVKHFEQQASAGIGAFELDGMMIDMPTVKQAQGLVQRARHAGLI